MKLSKTLLAGVAVTGAASFTLGVTGAASALSTNNVANTTGNTKTSTNVDAGVAGSLGLGLVGSSLLQGGSTNDTSATAAAKAAAGLGASNTVSTKDGKASTSTAVGAKANVGANAATTADKTAAAAGVGVDAGVSADTTTDTGSVMPQTPDLTSGLLNGGLLNGGLLQL